MLIDSHCHLDRLDLSAYNNDLGAALEAARARGVSGMLCVCISDDNRQRVVEIAQAHAGLYASVGVHPAEVSEDVVSVESLTAWAGANKVVALGETGLDYCNPETARLEAQKQSFRNHLIAGQQLRLPVIIHTRAAREDTLALMEKYGSRAHSGVLHCFTDAWGMAKAALDMNFYISISGITTFRNAQALREVVKKIPLERLLVETDSPWLAPVPYRGKSNEPKYVREVAEYIADLRQIDFSELAARTSENFYRLFPRAAET